MFVEVQPSIQSISDEWKAISFSSKKLSNAETRYNIFRQIVLAIYATYLSLSSLLKKRIFYMWIDHKLLIESMTNKYYPQEIRQLLDYITQFSGDICYIPGDNNVIVTYWWFIKKHQCNLSRHICGYKIIINYTILFCQNSSFPIQDLCNSGPKNTWLMHFLRFHW